MILSGPAHAPGLARLHAACFAAGESWDEAAMRSLLEMAGCFACLSDAGGMALVRVAADEAELLSIAVLPEARRRGVGGALLEEAMQAAQQRGAVRMLLEVGVGNVAASALYASSGFAAVGQRKAYYPGGGPGGGDAHLLARALSLSASGPLSACGSRPV